jgi:hypothetical protein
MRWTISFLSTMTLAAVAAAQSSSDPLEACAQKADSATRLACFDQEMQRRHTAGTSHEAPSTPGGATSAPQETPTGEPSAPARVSPPAGQTAGTASGTTASHADDDIGLNGAQLRKKLREEGVVEERPKAKPIVAQVTRAIWHPDHRYTLALDNGQVWEQVETGDGASIEPHETVTITPGALGSFFLKTSQRRYLRVRRLQ